MEIRYINAYDDRMKISKIYEESWKYAYKDIIPKDYLDSIESGKWVSVLDLPGWNTIVCVENDKFIGTCSFSKSRFKEYSSYGEIISIYLLPEYIGKGYGYELLNWATKELIKQGYIQILLWVLDDNHLAKEFYEKNGFIETDNYLDDNIGGKHLREVMFVFNQSI